MTDEERIRCLQEAQNGVIVAIEGADVQTQDTLARIAGDLAKIIAVLVLRV